MVSILEDMAFFLEEKKRILIKIKESRKGRKGIRGDRNIDTEERRGKM